MLAAWVRGKGPRSYDLYIRKGKKPVEKIIDK